MTDLSEPYAEPGESAGLGEAPPEAEAGLPPPALGAPALRRRSRRALAVWAIRLATVAVLFVVWEILGRRDRVFVAPLSTTVSHLVDLWRSGEIEPAIWRSNQALLIGFPISVLIGLPLGFLLGRVRVADRAISYWLDVALVIPMIAVVPVIIVALGLTLTARVLVVILFTLPIVALNARAAVRIVQTHLIEMSQSFGASRRQVWQSVIIPSSFAPVFTGLRVGLAHAISGMIVIELTLIPAGLGGLIVTFRSEFAAGDLYAVTLMILIEGLVLVGIAHALEQLVSRRLGMTE